MHRYKAITLRNFDSIPQIENHLNEDEIFDIRVVGNVLPFKANNYVVDELIDWADYKNDPIYTLTFPRKDMLSNEHYEEMAQALRNGAGKAELKLIANKIRRELNPHPAGQVDENIPVLEGQQLPGVQHKYHETMLFFPSQGQTCHAYCTFCFRWPQFTGMNDLKFAMRNINLVKDYLRANPQITDILFTGGDPLIMRTKILVKYFDALIESPVPTLKTIRIGTKSLTYWPHRFVYDEDADELLKSFEKLKKAGIHVALMAHINHPKELDTPLVEEAVRRIRSTGAVIRTQAPIMRNINDDPKTWTKMWQRQVELGMIPYYMFLARDTGAQHYFAIPLGRAWKIYQKAIQGVSGLARTVRGPSMSASPGKVQVLGVTEIRNEKVYVLQFLQGRKADWVHRPFFAAYDPNATWLDDLQPAFGEDKFFFEKSYPLTKPAVAPMTQSDLQIEIGESHTSS